VDEPDDPLGVLGDELEPPPDVEPVEPEPLLEPEPVLPDVPDGELDEPDVPLLPLPLLLCAAASAGARATIATNRLSITFCIVLSSCSAP
jgi:hypothetical protein